MRRIRLCAQRMKTNKSNGAISGENRSLVELNFKLRGRKGREADIDCRFLLFVESFPL